jgi:hypothetical protein
LGELSGGMLKRSSSAQKEKKKRRKSYGRRVSFAPDHRLETTHHFDVSPAAQVGLSALIAKCLIRSLYPDLGQDDLVILQCGDLTVFRFCVMSTTSATGQLQWKYAKGVGEMPDDLHLVTQSESQNLVDPVVVAAPGFNPEAATPVDEGWKNEDGHTVQITTDITTGMVSMELTNASPGTAVEVGLVEETYREAGALGPANSLTAPGVSLVSPHERSNFGVVVHHEAAGTNGNTRWSLDVPELIQDFTYSPSPLGHNQLSSPQMYQDDLLCLSPQGKLPQH